MSLISFALVFVASAAILWAALAALVLQRKGYRDRRERISRERRARYRDALASSDLPEREEIFGELSGDGSAQLDMIAVLKSRPPATPLPTLGTDREVLSRSLALQARDRDAVARGRAVLLLSLLGLDGASDVAACLLRDEDPDVRLAACAGLAEIADDRAAAALIGGLSEGLLPPERLIERLGAPWATEELLRALPRSDSASLRAALARALGFVSDPRADGPLVEMLESGEEEERINAARSLGASAGPERVAGALCAALKDPSPNVRAQAARSIGELRDWSAAEQLATSREVAELLRPRLADGDWWVRANAATALRGMGSAGISMLRDALHGDDGFARDRARESLALSGEGTGGPPSDA